MQWFACLTLFLVVLVTKSVTNATKNVLIVDPVGSPSHQVWMHSLTRAVANHGYNVTSLSCKLMKNPPPNLHTYFIDNVYHEPVEGEEDVNFLELTSMTPLEIIIFFTKYTAVYEDIFLESSGFKAIWNFPKDFKFDMIIYDYIGGYSLLSLADRFPEAKLIGASAYPAIEFTNVVTGAPGTPSFLPNMYMYDVEETFASRLESFFIHAVNHLVLKFSWFPTADAALERHNVSTKRSIREIYDSTVIQLTNYHPVLDFVSPIMPGVIPVGGLQIEKPQPLPAELEQVFASAEKGVILFSLGSNVKSEMLGEERLNEIIEALRQFPEYHFVWKIDLAKLKLTIPKNVFIIKWLPQNDILADKRTKLFISHAGGLSTQEATWYGVPMLALPVMFDQFPVSRGREEEEFPREVI